MPTLFIDLHQVSDHTERCKTRDLNYISNPIIIANNNNNNLIANNNNNIFFFDEKRGIAPTNLLNYKMEKKTSRGLLVGWDEGGGEGRGEGFGRKEWRRGEALEGRKKREI